MKSAYYRRTFAALGFVAALLGIGAFCANSIAREARQHHEQVVAAAKAITDRCQAEHVKLERLRAAIVPVQEFAREWKSLARLPEKEAAERVRSEIEAIAQRQLGLVTDNAITPQPERFALQGSLTRVQRVTLRASGKDLAALVTWLGKVEERFPAAIVEVCEFSSNVGGSTGLTLRLVQPLTDPAASRLAVGAYPSDQALLPDAIRGIDWHRYIPSAVKAAGAVGFQRNPLQPAVANEPRLLSTTRDDFDEITPRLERALDGRVRSVIRGASPIVVIDGRVFRVGDELLLGRMREKPVPEAKTKLKRIGDDQLVLQVYGGAGDHSIQRDVVYELPSFLRAR